MKRAQVHTIWGGILMVVALCFATPVSENGLLSVQGVNLVNEQGEPVQLRGMSTHGIQWYGYFYTKESIRALAQDWKADVIRLSLYARETGYEDDPVGFTAEVDQLIEWATEYGMYVLIDWHQLNPGDPNLDKQNAKTYFTHMANTHKDKNNIIYEICNEPNNEGVNYTVSWGMIKSYADELVPLIRAIDPNKIIIVGTPEWCQRPNDVIGNELAYDNIMYTVHFYAASHGEDCRDNLSEAINSGIPIFVTEFGMQESSGDGGNDTLSSEIWMDTLDKYNISWVNWNYSPNSLSGAAFQTWVTTGTYANCANDDNLKDAGLWIKKRIRDRLPDTYTDSVVVDSFANIFSDESKQTHIGAAYGYANGNTVNGGGLWNVESDADGSAIKAGSLLINETNLNSMVSNEQLAVSMITSTSTNQYPFAGISCDFIGTGNSYVDLSDLHSIRIKAKGSGTVRVALITKDIDDLPAVDRWGYYGNTITLSGSTENHVIKASQLFAQGWSVAESNGWGWDHGKGAVRGISITNIDANSDVSIEIEEILLRGVNYSDFGFTYKEPSGDPVGPTDLTLSNTKVDEHSVGAVIGTISVTTDAPSATNTFTVDDARFEISGTTLSLKNGVALDADNGNVTITLTVTDSENRSYSEQCIIEVLPVTYTPVISQIPSQSIAEGGSFVVISLDEYVSDVDNADEELLWSTSVTTNMMVTITNRIATITVLDENWNGSERVTFTVTDPDGLSASCEVVFTVTAENDAPIITQIPSQSIAEGGSFTAISLDEYVSDVDHAETELLWSTSVTTNMTVDITNRVATITALDENWNGSETVTFTVTDPDGLSATCDVVFTVTAVNDAPVLTPISSQSIAEGGSFVAISLDDFVSDIDNGDEELLWSTSATTNMMVTITNRIATIAVKDENWNGSERVTFTVTDPDGLSASCEVTFTVTAVNDAPVISQIPSQVITEGGSFATIALDDFVRDIDNADEELLWSTSAATKMMVTITNRVATITVLDENWNGSETITFSVTDPDGLSASCEVAFTVTAVNDAPVITQIPAQSIGEGGSFVAIALDDFVRDIDNADEELLWSTSAATKMMVTITNRVATITVLDENWNGSERVTFSVTDPDGLSATCDVVFTVTAVNDAPVLTPIPAQSIAEGGSFVAISLDEYVSDVDNAEADLLWSTSATTNIAVTITDRIATIAVKDGNWNGSERVTFSVTDPDGLSASCEVVFTVTAENDAPVITQIPSQSIAEGGSFVAISLDEYVSDVDNAETDLLWSTSATINMMVTITNRIATIAVKDENWNGSERVTFTVTDPDGLSATCDVVFTVTAVNDAPVLTPIPSQSIAEGGSFVAISLDEYVSDVDNAEADLLWSTSATTNIAVTITDRVATIAVKDENWNGSERVTFSVTDPDGLSASCEVVFTVTAVNDAPVITATQAQTVAEDTDLLMTLVMVTASDVDGDVLTLLVKEGANYSVTGSTVTPNTDYNGLLNVSVTVSDGLLESAVQIIPVTVTAVNDLPVCITPQKDTSVEALKVTTLDCRNNFKDVESQLAFTALLEEGQALPLWLSFSDGVFTIEPPKEAVGTYMVILTASDGDASVADTFLLTVEPGEAIEEVDTMLYTQKDIAFCPNPVPADEERVFFIAPEFLTGDWEIVIYDNLGNLLDQQRFSGGAGRKYSWDLRNSGGVPVGPGTYVALITYENEDGNKSEITRLIGVNR